MKYRYSHFLASILLASILLVGCGDKGEDENKENLANKQKIAELEAKLKGVPVVPPVSPPAPAVAPATPNGEPMPILIAPESQTP